MIPEHQWRRGRCVSAGVSSFHRSLGGAEIFVCLQVNSGASCDGGDLSFDSSFAATLSGLTSDTIFNVNATVLDGSFVGGDARHSAPTSCPNIALEVKV